MLISNYAVVSHIVSLLLIIPGSRKSDQIPSTIASLKLMYKICKETTYSTDKPMPVLVMGDILNNRAVRSYCE